MACYAEAWRRREEREWDRLAVLVCQVTAPYRKKALTPAEFLGRPLTGTRRKARSAVMGEDDDE